MPTARFLIWNDGVDAIPLRNAFALLKSECSVHKKPYATLLVPVRNSITSSVFEEVLGRAMISALWRGRDFPLPDGPRLGLRTRRTFEGLKAGGIILAVYPTERMLDLIDSAISALAIIVVPRSMADVRQWTWVWNPRIPGTRHGPRENLTLDPEAEAALQWIHDCVNIDDAFPKPDDEEFVTSRFRALHDNEFRLDPPTIRCWALRKGWLPYAANRLRRFAEAVVQGRRMRGGHLLHRDSKLIIAELRKRVARWKEGDNDHS